MDTIQIAATVMLTFVIFWLSLTERRMKGCPKGVAHKPWAKKVEDWRTETSRIPGLEQTFPADKGDYPHGRDCRIEWVRNRLDYFAGKLDAIAAALVGPR